MWYQGQALRSCLASCRPADIGQLQVASRSILAGYLVSWIDR